MKEHELDILLISEAHCNSSTNIKFKDYQCYTTNHPDGTSHAGTAVIVRNTIKHSQMPQYKTEHLQATTIAVEDQTGHFSVAAVYCPPRHKITDAMFSHFFGTLGNRFVTGGDWNAKHTFWGSRLITTRGRNLKLSVETNHLSTISTGEPTYWPSDMNKTPDLLDFFIIKGLSIHYFKPESCYDSSSDHTPVLLTMNTKIIEYIRPDNLCNKFTDWVSFREYIIKKINLKIALKTPEDIDEATKYIMTLIQSACWINTPAIHQKKVINNHPMDIKRAVLDKRKLRRIWHQSRHPEDKSNLNRASKELREMLQSWHDSTFEAQIESLTPTSDTNYSLWKYTKNYNRPQVAKPPIKMSQNWARTSQEKADVFAEHLTKVFRPNNSSDSDSEEFIKQVLNMDLQMSIPPEAITVRETWGTIKRLVDKKAPGFDLISKEVLTQLPRKAIAFLTTVYNGILRVQYFPQLWKVSQILMIAKPGKPPNEITSYRPISLLPILSKVFVKLLLRRIQRILNHNKTIPNHQFGFRQQHSTVEQVHRVCERVRKTLEEKEYCASVFLDIQQAFDRVWHDGLLYKIKKHIPHSYYLLLKSYLSERLFQVKELDATSKFFEIKAGVPQGSVLGPVLYTLYTADLPEVEGVTTATFADDTAVLASNKDSVVASQTLQKGLDVICKWLHVNRINVSTSKSVQVTFTLRKGNCPPVNLDGIELPHKDNVKYLGLHLDRRMTWRHHIKTKREEIKIRYRNLYWITGRNSKLSIDNKLLIYKVMLKPIWMYGIQLWGSSSDSNISMLQRTQNIILRHLVNVPWFVPNNEIHKQLEMKTVKEEINSIVYKYKGRLVNHPNELALGLLTRGYENRLKRKNII